MPAYKCFDHRLDVSALDARPFKFGHTLMGHRALSLENLAQVVQELPKDQVFYSSGLLQKDDDFDRAHLDKATGLSLKDTIEKIETSNSYVMVRAPETHASFKPLFADLLHDVETVMQERGVGRKATDPMLYLFIASPKSLTPFHIDRYTTFLMQFQGSKEVTVFPPFDERVVTAKDTEAFVAHSGLKVPYHPESEPLGTTFQFGPGEAIHIPFVAGHHVLNGPGNVSVSMSIIFNSDATVRQMKAMRFNFAARKALGALGYSPSPVGAHGLRDKTKATLFRAAARALRK